MSNEAPTDALRMVPDGLGFDGNDMTAAADALRPWMKNYPPSTRTERCVEAANAILTTFCLRKNVSILAAAPASPLPGGGPHERWSILNHLGESWTPENFNTERQATAYLDGWRRDNPKMDLSKHKVIPVLVTMAAAPTGDA